MFRLARDLSRTVSELEATLSAAELVEWLAFYNVEHEQRAGIEPPLEFDDDDEHSDALDALFVGKGVPVNV